MILSLSAFGVRVILTNPADFNCFSISDLLDTFEIFSGIFTLSLLTSKYVKVTGKLFE